MKNGEKICVYIKAGLYCVGRFLRDIICCWRSVRELIRPTPDQSHAHLFACSDRQVGGPR